MLFFNKDAYYRDFASATLKKLLLGLVVRTGARAFKDPALEIITYIKEHYHERILAKDVAVLFNFHPNHLNRLVKLATGKGFKDYLIFYRIKVAKDMLVSTSESVTEISEACGFTTASYFAELFTRQEGMSPREYRRAAKASIV